MESTTNPPTPSAAAELSSPPTPAAMQVRTCPALPFFYIKQQVEGEGLSKAESTTMLCESAISGQIEDPLALNVNDLELICDLFYLPCEHGPKVSVCFFALPLNNAMGVLLHCFPAPSPWTC